MNGFTRLKKWIFIAFVFVIGAVFLIECGGGGGGDSDGSNAPPQNIPNITFEKESGSAGSIVKVFGIDIESCPVSNSEIKIGGEIAPALLNDKGELLMMLPLYYDEGTKWPAPPIGAQNVEIYCDDKLLTTLPEAMTITELNPAPGTTELLIADYSQIVSDFKYITSMMAPIPGLQQQLFDALLSAMQAFLDGNSANSLPTMINEIKQDDPEFLALLDAIHAASGAYENIDSFKKLMTGLKSDVSAAASMVSNNEPVSLSSYEITSPVTQFTHARTTMSATNSAIKHVALPDESLALQMQLYSTFSLFADQVISDTKTTFANIFGALSIFFKKIPAKKTIDIILHILDYSFKHLLLSILPATLEPIELELPKTELENSQME